MPSLDILPGTDHSASTVESRMKRLASPSKARDLQRFFKTGPGEYAEGDRFLGVMVPETRKVVREFRALPHAEVIRLLKSPFHEIRLLALLIWVEHYKKGTPEIRARIHRDYLKYTRFINNWDLIDLSAHEILGTQAEVSPGALKILYRLIESKSLWERRMALLAAGHFIRKREFGLILEFSERVLKDEHDLIHKASGWMLREAGKRDITVLREFLKRHAAIMPRTMLRYSIEKLTETERKRWMSKKTRL